MNTFGVVLFHTTSAALRAERILSKAQLVVKLIPTPREFSSDCGLALRFHWSQAEQIRTTLDTSHVELVGVHPLACP